MRNIAVILASGTGSRFGSKVPKQFVKLAGKPVIQYTIEVFQSAPDIDEIIIVTCDDYIDLVSELVMVNNLSKVTKVISGGKERYESSWSALHAITDDECNVIFHDAVRPFVSHRIIADCVEALNDHKAVDVAVGAIDTIIKVKNNNVMAIPDRRFLRRGQTPQAFKKSAIVAAYNEFIHAEVKVASDDCGIFMRAFPHEPVYIVEGEESNFKITHQQDIYLADNIIRDGIHAHVDKIDLERDMSNLVVVIFGGTSGIGRALAGKVRMLGGNIYCYGRSNGCDITDCEQIAHALAHVQQIEGKIDFIVNSAGVLIKKPLSFASDEDIALSCNVNYLGAINIAKESYQYLEVSHGMLLNFTSSSYTRGRAGYALYSSSKAAVVNLTQALSEEWNPKGIKVNCINPERTATPMRTANFGIEPAESLLSAEEVADVALSVMLSSITGQIIPVKKPLSLSLVS